MLDKLNRHVCWWIEKGSNFEELHSKKRENKINTNDVKYAELFKWRFSWCLCAFFFLEYCYWCNANTIYAWLTFYALFELPHAVLIVTMMIFSTIFNFITQFLLRLLDTERLLDSVLLLTAQDPIRCFKSNNLVSNSSIHPSRCIRQLSKPIN